MTKPTNKFPPKDIVLLSGFTLLEVLIAVALFALVSTTTFAMFQQTIKAESVFKTKSKQLVEMQRAHRLISADLSQLISRSIRNEMDQRLPPLTSHDFSNNDATSIIELTRTGRPNPLNRQRSDLLRLQYVYQDKKIVRRTWKQLDRIDDSLYQDQLILNNIKSWQVKYLLAIDSNTQHILQSQWINRWPPELIEPTNSDPLNKSSRFPQAIEISFIDENDINYRWLFSDLGSI